MPSPLAPDPMFVVNFEPIETHYPIRVMNPLIGVMSKWKCILLLKLWWIQLIKYAFLKLQV